MNQSNLTPGQVRRRLQKAGKSIGTLTAVLTYRRIKFIHETKPADLTIVEYCRLLLDERYEEEVECPHCGGTGRRPNA